MCKYPRTMCFHLVLQLLLYVTCAIPFDNQFRPTYRSAPVTEHLLVWRNTYCLCKNIPHVVCVSLNMKRSLSIWIYTYLLSGCDWRCDSTWRLYIYTCYKSTLCQVSYASELLYKPPGTRYKPQVISLILEYVYQNYMQLLVVWKPKDSLIHLWMSQTWTYEWMFSHIVL